LSEKGSCVESVCFSVGSWLCIWR